MALPKILNDDPLVIPVSLDDPYYPYYFTGGRIGTFFYDNILIFKFIGYNPDATGNQDPYSYDMVYSIAVTPLDPAITTPAFTTAPIVNSADGWINGTLADIGADIVEYKVTVTVSLVSDPASAVTKEFTFVLNGSIDASVTWLTSSNLGSLDNGAISDLSVAAKFGEGIEGRYRLSGGSLPAGIEVLNDGSLSGRINFYLSLYGSYTFEVEAYNPQYPTLITNRKEFNLTVVEKYTSPYDTIYMRGLLSFADRDRIDGLLQSVEGNSEIYRPTDPYFGVATEVKYQHQYGVKSVSAIASGNPDYFYTEYYAALERNFYWKYLTLGELNTAVARDSLGNIIYEVVYSKIIDNLVNSAGTSISKQVQFTNATYNTGGPYWTSWKSIYTSNTYYDLAPLPKSLSASTTASVTLPLNNVADITIGMQLTGFPGVTIINDANGAPPTVVSVDQASNTVSVSVAQTIANKQQVLFNQPVTTSYSAQSNNPILYPNSLPNMRQQIADDLGQYENYTLIPRWMDSQQADGSVPGYIPCWVICYTLPGKSAAVLADVRQYLTDNQLVLNQICFHVDRIEVDRSQTYTWGQTAFEQWPSTPPSASVGNDSQDAYINFPRKTILR